MANHFCTIISQSKNCALAPPATHALKNALIPVITVLALQFGSLLTGAIITEQIFSWPGLGRLLISSITSRDYPQVQASILVIALTYIMVNFISDLLYGVADPRIKLE